MFTSNTCLFEVKVQIQRKKCPIQAADWDDTFLTHFSVLAQLWWSHVLCLHFFGCLTGPEQLHLSNVCSSPLSAIYPFPCSISPPPPCEPGPAQGFILVKESFSRNNLACNRGDLIEIKFNGSEFTSCIFRFLMRDSFLVFLQSHTGSEHFRTKEEGKYSWIKLSEQHS